MLKQHNKYQQNILEMTFLNDKEVISNILSEGTPSERILINKQIIEVLSNHFGPKFGKFLAARLRKNKVIKNVDLLNLLEKYKESPNNDLYENIFLILVDPMIDYFISRTIGFRNDLRKITPFKKAVGTGNFKIDYTLYKIINEFVDNENFLKALSDNLRDFIDGKLDDVYADSQYKALLSESTLTDLWRKWTGQERRNRIRLLSDIYKYLPKLNKKVKKNIRTEIFNAKYSLILTLRNKVNAENIAKIVAGPIVDNFISQMASMQILKDTKELEPFYVVILKSLRNKKVVKAFRDEIEEIIKIQIIKSKKND